MLQRFFMGYFWATQGWRTLTRIEAIDAQEKRNVYNFVIYLIVSFKNKIFLQVCSSE